MAISKNIAPQQPSQEVPNPNQTQGNVGQEFLLEEYRDPFNSIVQGIVVKGWRCCQVGRGILLSKTVMIGQLLMILLRSVSPHLHTIGITAVITSLSGQQNISLYFALTISATIAQEHVCGCQRWSLGKTFLVAVRACLEGVLAEHIGTGFWVNKG
ncbi:hypothetical protein IFR05_005905 [Cadophora sp. M221]|nr:hypothetical protein IFR05_005905 [Cadophora sp. M221]